MSIWALSSIMGLSIWAPNSFVLINKKIMIPWFQVDHLDFYFWLKVSKRTKLFEITWSCFIWVGLTELGFVSSGVVNLLNFIMRKRASHFFYTFFTAWTKLMTVLFEARSPPIKIIMVVDTSFLFMRFYRISWDILPLRGHGLVLWVTISNRKY